MKCDIVVSRDMTINVGNYSSIKPSVSITLKDIDREDFDKEYNEISTTLDSCMLLEIIKLGEESDAISDMGFKSYLKSVMSVKHEAEKVIKEYSEKALFKL